MLLDAAAVFTRLLPPMFSPYLLPPPPFVFMPPICHAEAAIIADDMPCHFIYYARCC
jgi:hypothetical protein